MKAVMSRNSVALKLSRSRAQPRTSLPWRCSTPRAETVVPRQAADSPQRNVLACWCTTLQRNSKHGHRS